MYRCVSDYASGELTGRTVYAILENRIRYAEIWNGCIPNINMQIRLQEILLIDKESMCEPIEEATRYIRPSELFFDKQGAEKELFQRKLKGSTNE